MTDDAKEIRVMANAMRKAADAADKMADIMENEQLTDGEREEQLETATAEFVVQMMKMQAIQEAM